MFDLGWDKLIVVGILIGLVAGPERLREWRRSVPRTIGRWHALYQQGRAQVVEDLDELAPDWREYDPRLLHPRRILKDLTDAARQEAVRTEREPQEAMPTGDAGVPTGEFATEESRVDGEVGGPTESVDGDPQGHSTARESP